MAKTGYKTTEFWLSLSSIVFAALVLAGVIGTEEARAWQEVVAALVLLVVPAIYTHSRTSLKCTDHDHRKTG